MHKLTQLARFVLRQPMGEPIRGKDLCNIKDGALVSVGDISSLIAFEAGKKPRLAIVDFKVKRNIISKSMKQKLLDYLKDYKQISVKNPSSLITDESEKALKDIAPLPATAIIVDGEEDLLFLLAVKYMPSGNVIVYGQPGIGLMKVIISDELKKKVDWLLSIMEKE